MSANEVIKAIKRHSKFLITSHIDAEGDALGSELALASLLRKLGKKAYIVNSDRIPSNYSFLPGAKRIFHRLSSCAYQVAFIIDCPDRQRIGNVTRLIDNEKMIINIDHHLGNKNFGKINWIDTKASSTGEMIYRLFGLTQTKLARCDALNIYTAILTDTGSFRHFNTTSTTLRISSELLEFGIEPAKIYTRIYEDISVQNAVSVAKVISNISFAANNKIAQAEINNNLYKRIKGRHEILDKVLDFARSVNTVKVVVIFSQVKNRLIKVNFRSKSPIDVQRVAQVFGGGGHKFASGCTIKASLKQAQEKVLKEVKRIVKSI